jgi:hypothetical protein
MAGIVVTRKSEIYFKKKFKKIGIFYLKGRKKGEKLVEARNF